MSQDFLIWTDFHPILVGAGCLALGYVYGRHYRPVSAIPADVPPASNDLCCTQSQCQTYFEDLERPCKCCVSAPARLDAVVATGKGKKASHFTRSPYLVQDAAEGFEQSERSTKRDLATDMENLDAEPPGMRQLSCEPYFEKGYQVLEEEQFLQAKTAYKKQKVSKGQADMGNPVKNDEDDSAAAPWSRELLHKRIDYFNNVSETSATDESKKVRFLKKKSLSKGERAFDSTSADSNPGGVGRTHLKLHLWMVWILKLQAKTV